MPQEEFTTQENPSLDDSSPVKFQAKSLKEFPMY